MIDDLLNKYNLTSV